MAEPRPRKTGDGKKAQSRQTGGAGRKSPILRGVEPVSPQISLDLAQSKEQRMLYAAERSGLGLWDLDLIDHTAYRTMEHARIFGYESLEPGWTFEKFLEHVLAEDREKLVLAFEEATSKKFDWYYECRIRRCDGEVLWIEVSGGYVVDADGRAIRMVGSVRDITRRMAEEQERRAHEDFLAVVFDDNPVPLCTTRFPEGRIADVNQAFVDLTGFERDEAIGKTTLELGFYADLEERADVVKRLRDSTTWVSTELQFRRKSGEIRTMLALLKKVVIGGEQHALGGMYDITDQVQADQALRDSEERYRLLAEHGSDVIWLFDLAANRFTYVSPSVERLRGYTAREVLQQSMQEALAPEHYRILAEQLPGRLASYEAGDDSVATETNEVHQTCKNGGIVATEALTTLIAGPDRKVTHIRGVTVDITERLRAEQALRQSEQQFRTTVELAPEAVYVRQGDCFVYLNPAAVRLFGAKDADQLLGSSALERFAPEERESTAERMRKVDTEGEGTIGMSRTLLRLDGTPVHGICSAFPFTYHEESSALVFVQDVSNLRGALDELRGSEERFRMLVEAAPLAINICMDEEFIYANAAAVQLFGAKNVWALLGSSIIERFANDERDYVRERWRLLAEQAVETIGASHSLLRLDGSQVPVVLSVVPITYEGKRCALVLAQDTTQLTGALDELRGSEERFQALLASAPDGIVVTSGGRVAYANHAMAALLGWQGPESVVGSEWLPHVAQEYRDSVLGVDRGDFQLGAYVPASDLDLLRRDGSTVSVEANAVVTHFRGERATLVFARDKTERRKADTERAALQQQLFQAQKMESVGLLAGGVAHDYNNILTVQKGYCELMKAMLHKDDPLYSSLEEIETCIERAVVLTRQLLAFSRKQELRPITLDLNTLVKNLVGMLHRLIGEDVELVTVEASSPAIVVADPGQIEQVLVNLSVNARAAMPQGGRLAIEVSLVEAKDIAPRCPRCGESIADGWYVMVSVSDNGCGMDLETQSKAFEPFFTTKGEGKGTGLGLSTVYGIVNQSRGHVWVESEIGRGTTFRIILPYSGAETTAQTSVDADSKGMGVRSMDRLSVLVVEDEPALRDMVSSMLEQLGHGVAAAANGQEAAAMVRDEGLRPDVVLTDLVLPDINGRGLADQLHATVPDAGVIYMSGYADDTIISGGSLRLGVSFLHKPFTVAGLADKIREVVGT